MADDDRACQELASLAESVRRLIGLVVKTQAPGTVLQATATHIDEVARHLAAAVPTPPPARYPEHVPASGAPADFFPYDFVVGKLNPIAAPVRVAWENPKAIGRVAFGTPYEGPPGCVHGAVIAAAFDQVLNVANLMSGTPGPTARLELRFRRPPPLLQELRFEAWREKVEERKIYSAGRLIAGGEVTVEASGMFIHLSTDRVVKMLDGG